MVREVKKIAVVPGDGIGREVISEGLKVLKKLEPNLSAEFCLLDLDLGADAYLRTHEAMPDSVWKEILGADAIYLGAVGDPRVPPGILEREVLLRIRFDLDLYINLRPCEMYAGAFTPLKHKSASDIRFTVVRENTESVYTGVGGVFKKGTAEEVAIQEDVNTRKGVERAVRYAYELCAARAGKRELTLVDKANVLTYAHQLWRRVFSEVGQEYPQIKQSALYVDACAMDFVRRPERFDVIVTNNIFGDILTDLGAVISGGLGLSASANLRPLAPEKTVSRCWGMFEPVHGSAPDIAGKGLANPLAAILALKMLLEAMNEKSAAQKIEQAVAKVTAGGKIFKPESTDTSISTSAIGDLVVSSL